MSELKTVYVSIGNSDDKLTQKEWARFNLDTHLVLVFNADEIHGRWVSPSSNQYQNACWCVAVDEEMRTRITDELGRLASKYRQDSIAWAETTETYFIKGVEK